MPSSAKAMCNTWLHRNCASLPKPVFISLQNSSDPFFCPHCQLKNHAAIIQDLKATITSLTETIASLQTSVKSTSESETIKPIPADLPATVNVHPKITHTVPTNKPSLSSTHYEDKKYNIVMYGIKESPSRTSKTDRLENDLQFITKEFVNVELPIQASSIKDCFCLGKYKPDAACPRPILIKFLRSTEANVALSKITSFQAPVQIKPDLTPEERKAESALLKERWTLMQLGFDKKRIKIRNKGIFVENKLYGRFQNSEICRSQYNPPLQLDSNSDPASPHPAAPTNQPSSSTASKNDQ